jgi:hypothetical protein
MEEGKNVCTTCGTPVKLPPKEEQSPKEGGEEAASEE